MSLPQDRIEDALVLLGPGRRERERSGEPRTTAKRTRIRLAPGREPCTQREAVQGIEGGPTKLLPRQRVAERDTPGISRKGKGGRARVENIGVGPEHEHRRAHGLGNTRIGGFGRLVHSNLVIGEDIGQRLQIAPRIARSSLGSDEDTVSGLPGNGTSRDREDEGKRRHRAGGRLSTDDEAAAQRM